MSNKWRRGNSNKSWGEVRGVRKRPPGLQGRDIGLFYRDRQSKKNKLMHVVSLTIPQNVISQVVLNIKAIESLAAKENIPIKRTEYFIKKELSTGTIESEEISEPLQKSRQIKSETAEHSTKTTKSEEACELNDNTIQEASASTSAIAEHSTKTIKCEEACEFNDNVAQVANASTSAAGLGASVFKVPSTQLPGTSLDFKPLLSSHDYIPIGSETSELTETLPTRQLSLRGSGDYKYGYKDIITGTFEEKLNENLAKGVNICAKTQEYDDLSLALHEEYKDMITRPGFKNMMSFRKKLPTYKKSSDLLSIICNNQIVVISGETGCGKSTQVPQIILDDAICNNKGAYIHILVTQPRRIAASSLAARVAQERDEQLGHSVGYAIRLEKTEARPRGSIMYCTTGILLADLEVSQGLTDYSHIILDEAHERDCHMDFSMCMLKQVLQKRKDLKLILMSATIDSDRLSAYFDDCPAIHIEGLAYPVQPVYLEEILQEIKYQLPEDTRKPGPRRFKWREKKMKSAQMEKDIQYKAEIGPWLESIKSSLDREVYVTLQDSRIEDMNIELIIELLFYICQGAPGAILVFLPGIGDITKLIKSMAHSGAFPSSQYEIYPLHSKLPTLDQRKIFDRPPGHVRKIIIATNIAETSITIDDIVYVVDCGRIKMTGLNVEDNVSTLNTVFVSKANLMQRRGRAGRCQPGTAFHLITSYRAKTIAERLLPELQRSNLLEPVLMIKKLRLGKAATALRLVPDVPAEITIEKAVTHLQKCGALDDEENLTPLGWHLARLPVHPAAGKLLLFGALFGCLDRAASVAAVWGFKDPFNLVIGKEREVDESKRYLTLGEPSDHVAISEAIIQWERCGRQRQGQFAYEHFLSTSTLHMLCEMKQQLYDTLGQMGFLTSKNVRSSWENRNADNLCVFKAIVAAALYPNIAIVKWTNPRKIRKQQRIRVQTPEDGKVSLHPSSVMNAGKGPPVPLCSKPGANWLAYWLKQKSSELFLHEVTLVYTLPLLFFGELVVSKVEDAPEDCYISVSTVKVQCKKETADVLFKLRALLDQVLASMVKDSSERPTRHSQFDELVLKAVMDLITAEDERVEDMTDDSDSDRSDYSGNWNNSQRSSFY